MAGTGGEEKVKKGEVEGGGGWWADGVVAGATNVAKDEGAGWMMNVLTTVGGVRWIVAR